jgi:hypothetical protein
LGVKQVVLIAKQAIKKWISLERRFLAQNYEIKNVFFVNMEALKIALKNTIKPYFLIKPTKNMPLYLRFNARSKLSPYTHITTSSQLKEAK